MTRTFGAVLVLLAAGAVGVTPALAQHAAHQPGEGTATATATRTPASGDAVDHLQHQPAPRELPPFIPALTDEDRTAAFPRDVGGHAVHDRSINSFVLFERLERQSNAGGAGVMVDTKGWVGSDRDRLWFRAEGGGDDSRVRDVEAHALYGRRFSRWWDVVAGVRQDFGPGPARTWAAVGIQGLAPYWFEVELTGYVGESGRTHLRGEVEYELLLTNRLVLQPLVQIDVFGKSDPERGIGAGVSTTEAGLRLRYELKREFAPYVGVTWNNAWGRTAELSEAGGEETAGARLVTGLRLWF